MKELREEHDFVARDAEVAQRGADPGFGFTDPAGVCGVDQVHALIEGSLHDGIRVGLRERAQCARTRIRQVAPVPVGAALAGGP